MTIVNGYIFRAIVSMTSLVVLALLALGVFIEFVSQLDDIGEGSYTLSMAILYVMLKIPLILMGILPASVLLGALLGLGNLATHSELIVLRSSGVSLFRLARSVLIAGAFLAVVSVLISEFITPPMERYGRQMKAEAKYSGVDIAGGTSAWLRNGSVIFNIFRGRDGQFGGVYIFETENSSELKRIGHADSAEINRNQQWVLNNLGETLFSDDNVQSTLSNGAVQSGELSPDLLALTIIRHGSLNGFELYGYIKHLKSNGLDSRRYEIELWGRIATFFGTATMTVLALPFVLGSLRSTGAGARMLIGVLIGVSYFLLNRTFSDSGTIFELNPILMGSLPTLILIMVTVAAYARAR